MKAKTDLSLSMLLHKHPSFFSFFLCCPRNWPFESTTKEHYVCGVFFKLVCSRLDPPPPKYLLASHYLVYPLFFFLLFLHTSSFWLVLVLLSAWPVPFTIVFTSELELEIMWIWKTSILMSITKGFQVCWWKTLAVMRRCGCLPLAPVNFNHYEGVFSELKSLI